MKPITEEAVPARWPSGSMASELKLEPIQPNWNMTSAKKMMKTTKGIGCGPKICTMSQMKLRMQKPRIDACDRRRMPKRPTSCELMKDEKAINSATPAKATGI